MVTWLLSLAMLDSYFSLEDYQFKELALKELF
jgi:hypothetical protein